MPAAELGLVGPDEAAILAAMGVHSILVCRLVGFGCCAMLRARLL
jgi:hypothetical protein